MPTNARKQSILYFIELIEPSLVSFGFETRLQNNFLRRYGNRIDIVHFSLINGSNIRPDVTVVNLGIRFVDVEQLVANLFPGDIASNKDNSATIGVQLGRLSGEGQLRFDIGSQSARKYSFQTLVAMLNDYAYPYFTENGTLQKLLERLESNDFHDWHMLDFDRRVRLPIVYSLMCKKEKSRISLDKNEQELECAGDSLTKPYRTFSEKLKDVLANKQ